MSFILVSTIKTAAAKKIGIDPGFKTHLMTTQDDLNEHFKKTHKKRGKEIELRPCVSPERKRQKTRL